MSKLFPYLIALLFMHLPLFASPALSLAGVDNKGVPMRFGSGAWSENFCHPALVSDDGTVHFIAKMPDIFLDGADYRDNFRAVYKKRKTSASSEMHVEGYNSAAYNIFSKKWWHLNWQVSAAGLSNDFFLIREDLTDDIGNSSLYLRRFSDDKSIGLFDISKQTLRLTSTGDMLAITANNLNTPLFFQVSDAFTEVEIFDNNVFTGYTRKGIALSPDGNRIYFASTKDMDGGKLGLYAYNRIEQSHQLLADVGTAGLDPQVQCAAAAEAVVYRNAWIDGKLVTPQIVVSWLDQAGNYILQACGTENLSDCADPQISADGRFVIFSAKPQENTPLQIFRYDRLAEKLKQVTNANADAYKPSISPNGRYLTFVSAATNLGHSGITQPQVWLADMGPTLLDASLDIFQQQTLEVPIQVSGASENAKIRLAAGKPAPNGKFLDTNGNTLDLEKKYSLSSLPLTYQAGKNENGTISVTVQITDGEFNVASTLQITIYDHSKAILSCVSLNAEGKYVGDWRFNIDDISCTADGSKLSFVTSLPLLTDNKYTVSHAYLRDLASDTLILLSGDQEQTVDKITISGDGKLAFFIRANKLWKYDIATKQLTVLISSGLDNIKPATDVSGSILAYSKNGKVVLSSGQEIPELNCTTLRLNRDGKVLAILDKTGGLHLYFADAAAPVTLANAVSEFAMNQAGNEVFFLQNGKLFCQKTTQGDATEFTLPEGISAAGIKNLQLSGNGRFLAWVRDFTLNDIIYPDQQFLFDLENSKEILISAGTELPGNGRCSNLLPTALSATGRQLFFASEADNLLADNDNNAAQDLFRAILPKIDDDTPTVASGPLSAIEDTPEDLSLTLYSPKGNALVPLLVSDQSVKNAALTLKGLVPGRNGYAVHYHPVQDFCGEDSFEVQLWDGAKLSEPQTVNVEVENVNDPPMAQAVTETLAEGAVLSVNLPDYADDPDLRNSEPDVLTFSLLDGAPAWAKVNATEMLLEPDFLTVTHAESGKKFIFFVQVCDNHGSCVEMPVTITITDLNQAPTLQLTQETIIQESNEIVITKDIFAAIDPDPEDMDSLLIRLQMGDEIVDKLLSADFPFAFEPAAGTIDQLQISVYAMDALDAISQPETLAVLLKRVNFDVAEFWGYRETAGKISWEALSHGWNLLSLPFAVAGSELKKIFGESALWVWDAEKQRYALADQLFAGQGFWIYIDDLESISPAKQELSAGRIAAPELEPGWNLRGRDWMDRQENERPEAYWQLAKSRNWEKTDSPNIGKAYWILEE